MKTAELFCTCTGTEIFFCRECLFLHSQKRTRGGHPTWPISDLSIYQDHGYFDRQEAFCTVPAQAKQMVQEVDKAIEEYQALVDKVIEEILNSSQTIIAELMQVKAQLSTEVQTSLEEVEKLWQTRSRN